MTATGEFSAGDADFQEQSYPTAFGVTFTPTVQGILLAVAGLGLAALVATQVVAPAYEELQTLKTDVDSKTEALARQSETAQRVSEVVANRTRAKAKNVDVRSLFSNQAALETLLLDLNQLIVTSGAQLLQFTPDYATSGIVADGSLGPELNNKLKRQVTTVSFQGSFAQTMAILKEVDRSQTVLVLQDFSVELPTRSSNQSELRGVITSKFKLHAYVPLTPAEAKAAQDAAAAREAAAQQQQK